MPRSTAPLGGDLRDCCSPVAGGVLDPEAAARLVNAGLLAREQRERWSYYRIVDGALSALADALTAR
jgi:hypothetical protein